MLTRLRPAAGGATEGDAAGSRVAEAPAPVVLVPTDEMDAALLTLGMSWKEGLTIFEVDETYRRLIIEMGKQPDKQKAEQLAAAFEILQRELPGAPEDTTTEDRVRASAQRLAGATSRGGFAPDQLRRVAGRLTSMTKAVQQIAKHRKKWMNEEGAEFDSPEAWQEWRV